MTTISVVLPVRDGEAFLAEAIDSVVDQTYRDLELIVVDDGSTDDSVDIARAAAQRDGRVRIVANGGRGVSAALNTGIGLATGEWIGRMDADDVSLPHRFERQLAAAGVRPDVIGWASWAHAIDERRKVISAMTDGPTTDTQFRRLHAAGRLRPVHVTMLVRRDAMLEAGGYDPAFDRAQDIELWDRMGERGIILTVPEPLVLVRVHGASNTTTGMARTLQTHRFVAARRAATRRGLRLSFDEFVAAEATAPAWRRLRLRAEVASRLQHRRAGVALASGLRGRAVVLAASAVMLAPHVAVPRMVRQVVAPRLPSARRRSREAVS